MTLRPRRCPLRGPRPCGFRHRDWTVFCGYEFPEDDGDFDEWASRTVRYFYLADLVGRRLHDDDRLHNHDLP